MEKHQHDDNKFATLKLTKTKNCMVTSKKYKQTKMQTHMYHTTHLLTYMAVIFHT